MKILIAEDDAVSRRLLEATLTKWGHEVLATPSGDRAWELLQQPGSPLLLVLDWLMPGLDGLELCRRARALPSHAHAYILLLTSRQSRADLITGLAAGADDYLVKPFDHGELRARLQVGMRVLQLQATLAERVRELEEAAASVKTLQGLLPICSYCKKIRDDGNYWHRVETYIAQHARVRFSHGICPDCNDRLKADLNPKAA
ncbi:MAG: hypothetical protein RJA22_2049 [Verrucomicrobiota bacterium]|jgi:DNA-binding response OmpR family regulator